jgi:acyl carrier protein
MTMSAKHHVAHGSSPSAVNGFDVLMGRVHGLLVDDLHLDCPTVDTDIVASGALDSFAMVELIVNVEEQFGVTVPVDQLDVNDLRSARRIADLLTRLDQPDASG